MRRPVVPRAITREDAGLRIEWAPGHEGFYAARGLRLACGCAACVDEITNRPLLDPATVSADVRPAAIALVGGYGLQVTWSDGHSTGIYTFEWLRERCPCAACGPGREERAGGG